ncbi:magnesium/cobalt transporter CorA [Moraxella boevrei]|uniref:magnesium/cobalt transporter CorA n=1 Tax=Faucicola boevrei TaxID=346665 RepID=UPI00373566D4
MTKNLLKNHPDNQSPTTTIPLHTDEPSQDLDETPTKNQTEVYQIQHNENDEDELDLDLHGEDSYIYGEDYEEDEDGEPIDETDHTPPEYNPDAELDESRFVGTNEVSNCFSYSRKTGEKLGEIELDDVRRELANNNVFVWVGLHDPSAETIHEVKEAFDLHELAIEDAFAEHQRAKVESYGSDSVFVVVRTAKLTDNTIRYGTTAIFMGKQYIITIRQGASHSYESVRDYCHRRPEKLRLGPIFVLHAILDFVVDNYLPITEKLGRYLREQEREIFSESFDIQTLRNLYELKSQLVHMRAVILPVQDICNFFINHKKNDLTPTFPSQAKPYFRDVNDHLLRALDAVNGLNEMLSVAMDTYMAVVTMGQNEVVRKLAAWAGILAVPTAMAGIYGMNFDNMPELSWRYGYFVLLGLIFAICGTLYYRFRKADWL